MLQVTPAASEYLRTARDERGIDSSAGARFVRNSAGIGLTFAPAPALGDQVLSGTQIPVYVPEDLAVPLANSIIDVRREDGGSKLVLRPQ